MESGRSRDVGAPGGLGMGQWCDAGFPESGRLGCHYSSAGAPGPGDIWRDIGRRTDRFSQGHSEDRAGP